MKGLTTGIEVRGGEDHPRVYATAKQGFLQWTRHLKSDPGYVNLVVGDTLEEGCEGHHDGCYTTERPNGFISKERLDEIPKHWICIGSGDPCNFVPRHNLYEHHHPDPKKTRLVIDTGMKYAGQRSLLGLLTHEAGHRFDYLHPYGVKETCSGGFKCHAADGSRSVMSYDHDRRIHPDKEDIENMGWPEAVAPVWNPSTTDTYKVTRAGARGSGITKWGVWIDHEFRINDHEIHDRIAARGWIDGTPSNSPPTGNATYRGDFLGMDMSVDYLGTLLQADAALDYSLNDRTMDLTLDNFNAHRNGTWGNSRLATQEYRMNCPAFRCTSDTATAAWHSNGWVAGTVADQANEYIGAFTAEEQNQ